MDSSQYFTRAEKQNRRFHVAVVVLLLAVILVLGVATLAVYRANSDNHRTNVNSLNIITENEVKLNQNLTGSLHCVLLLTTSPTSFTDNAINKCFNIPQNITSQPNK